MLAERSQRSAKGEGEEVGNQIRKEITD